MIPSYTPLMPLVYVLMTILLESYFGCIVLSLEMEHHGGLWGICNILLILELILGQSVFL